MIFSEQGIKADPNQIVAIQHMNPPNNKKELLRFLGMTKYLMRFVPNLSSLSTPLRFLLKNDATWIWGPEQQASFNELKEKIVNAPVLQYFNLGGGNS